VQPKVERKAAMMPLTLSSVLDFHRFLHLERPRTRGWRSWSLQRLSIFFSCSEYQD